jgi:hypothetical protein
MSALVVSAVVREGDVHVTDEFYRTRRQRAAKRWGDGTIITIRIEPEDEASKHHHYKHLFGHYLTPVSDYTGYTVTELKDEMKARFLPDGMTSLTDMNAEQFEEFNRSVEQCIREEIPEAFERCADAMALYDRRTA